MSAPLDLQIARRARALITKPENWCRLWFGEDAKGVLNIGDLEFADKLCAHGALMRAASETIPDPHKADDMALGIVCKMLRVDDPLNAQSLLWRFNRMRDHAAVLRLFDRFIQGVRS